MPKKEAKAGIRMGKFSKDLIKLFEEFKKKSGKYKDLRLEEVEFEEKSLNDICERRMGFTPDTDPNGDIYFFKVGDLSKVEGIEINEPNTEEMTNEIFIRKALGEKSSKLKPIQKGDILVSFKLTVGVAKIYNSEEIAYCNEAIDILTVKEGYYNRYLVYIVGEKYKQASVSASIIGKSLNKHAKANITIPIPKPIKDEKGNEIYSSYDIQKAIAEFIEFTALKSDNIIEIMNEIKEKAEQGKKVLSHKLFEVLPRLKNGSRKRKLKDVIKLFEEFKKESGKYQDLRLEEVEFEEKSLNDICERRTGFTPETDPNGDIYFFKVGDLSKVEGIEINEPNTEEMTNEIFIREALGENSSKLKPIQKGNILVSFKLTVGVAKIYNSEEIAYCNEAIDILTVKEGYYNRYLVYIVGEKYKQASVSASIRGKSLNKHAKANITVPIPKPIKDEKGNEIYSSYELQKVIAEFIEFVFEKFDYIKNEADERIEKTHKLRNTLLKKLFRR